MNFSPPNKCVGFSKQNTANEKKIVREYSQKLKHFIVTSRFNNHTWEQNQQFRKNNAKFGCIYCSPTTITSFVPIDSPIFILEMNNETNRIMGVGVVRNHPVMNAFPVYDNGNYNRYQYIGKRRIDRSEMTPEQETIMCVFDILCFTGNKHQKRGHGLKLFPLDMLYRCLKIYDLVQFFIDAFSGRPNSSGQGSFGTQQLTQKGASHPDEFGQRAMLKIVQN